VVNSDSEEDIMAPILSSTPIPNQAGEPKKLMSYMNACSDWSTAMVYCAGKPMEILCLLNYYIKVIDHKFLWF